VNYERTLVAAAVALLVVAVVAALAVPGAVAERDEDVRPSRLALEDDVSVRAAEVTGETATLELGVRLAHRGGDAENVTVEVRAVDADTGLLATTERVDVGTVGGDREVAVTATVAVPREGGYRFRVAAYEDGRRVGSGSTTVSGVGSLTPAYARTSVRFERLGDSGVPSVSYSIANVSGDRVRLATRSHLTNAGDEGVGDLRLVVVARQAESNVVADRRTVDVGEIRPGRTAAVPVNLTVPDDYNYRLDAVLQRDGVVLGVTSATAELDPSRPLPENVTRERVDIEASDFEREEGTRPPEREPATTTEGQAPGFTGAVAVVAVVAAALLLRRRRHQ
jgi:PGF-CTERM protein